MKTPSIYASSDYVTLRWLCINRSDADYGLASHEAYKPAGDLGLCYRYSNLLLTTADWELEDMSEATAAYAALKDAFARTPTPGGDL